MTLNELAAEIHEISKSKGFWDRKEIAVGKVSAGYLMNDRNPGEVLMLIVTEVAEAMEEYRTRGMKGSYSYSIPADFPYECSYSSGPEIIVKTPHGTVTKMNTKQFENLLRIHRVPLKPEGVPSELADVIIRTLDACAAWGIDIETIIQEKIKYNKTRSHKHGKVC